MEFLAAKEEAERWVGKPEVNWNLTGVEEAERKLVFRSATGLTFYVLCSDKDDEQMVS